MLSEFVVQGMTVDGSRFEPADWAERFCDSLAKTGADGHKTYSSYVRPMVIRGVSSLVVRASLRTDIPEIFALVKHYIAENRLMVRAGRGGRYLQTTGAYPAVNTERRDPNGDNW